MTFQEVRRYFEQPIEAVLQDLSIPLRYENQIVPDSGSDLEFALVRLNFGTTAEIGIGCALEDLRGSLVVEVYVEKGYGPARGQAVAEDIMTALYALNTRPKERVNGVLGRVDPINGPNFTALDGQPYFLISMSCGVVASFQEP